MLANGLLTLRVTNASAVVALVCPVPPDFGKLEFASPLTLAPVVADNDFPITL